MTEGLNFPLLPREPYPVLGSVSNWMGKLISPLGAPMLSRDGVIELAARVKLIMGFALLLLIVVAMRYSSSLKSAPAASLTPGGPGESTTLSGPIGTEVKGIGTDFDALLQNLRQLRGEAGKRLQARIELFSRTFDNALPANRRCFEMVKSIEENYKGLLQLKGAVFLKTGGTMNKIDDKGVLQLPSDGNCLFHSLAGGLVLLESTLKEHGLWNNAFPVDNFGIRDSVNRYIIAHVANDRELQAEIDNAILEYVPILDRQQAVDHAHIEAERLNGSDVSGLLRAYQAKAAQIEILRTVKEDVPGRFEAHEAYITMTSGDEAFASSPHIYAFCKLYPAVGVRVSRKIQVPDRGLIISNEYNLPFNPTARFFINPVFNAAGDHYDLLVERH
jgi:hypothetical protein